MELFAQVRNAWPAWHRFGLTTARQRSRFSDGTRDYLGNTSGSRLTENSRRPCGYPPGEDAQRYQHRGERRRPRPFGGDRGGPEQPAEARVAGQDHPGHDGRARDGRDRAPDRQVQAVRLALAGEVHARGRDRPAARQDPAPAHPAPAASGDRPRDRADPDRAAARGDPLDRRRHGRGGRDQPQLGAPGVARPQAPAAPGADLQAVQGPGVRRQAARHRRPLPRPAGPRGRALGRREAPDSRPSTAPSPGCR